MRKKQMIQWLVCQILVGLLGGNVQTLKAESSVLEHKVIIVDPGHGGFDPGKPGIKGMDEKHLNLKIALLLRNYLERAGAIVIMTRITDCKGRRYLGKYSPKFFYTA